MRAVSDATAAAVRALTALLVRESKCMTIELSVRRDGRATLVLYDIRSNVIDASHKLDTLESDVVVESEPAPARRL